MSRPFEPCDRIEFESIIRGLGIQFEFCNDREDTIMWDVHKRDPDTVYLYEPGYPIKANSHSRAPCDALVVWKGETREIRWKRTGRLVIHKYFQYGAVGCAVCFETKTDFWHCARCGGRLCHFCTMRLALTKEAMFLFLHRIFKCYLKCPQCRAQFTIDPRRGIFGVMKRMAEFTQYQQNMLLFLKAAHPAFDEMYAEFLTKTKQHRIQVYRRSFRRGCCIEIVGLRNKAEWNGERAKIVGERIVKNGSIRWPVQLQDSDERALLKQCNMKKVNQFLEC